MAEQRSRSVAASTAEFDSADAGSSPVATASGSVTLRVVIFDIDGTLADCDHRRHHLLGEKKNWDAFYEALDEDLPNTAVITLAAIISASGMPLVLCTGRPAKYRERTLRWLKRHNIEVRELYTRHDGDHRPDHIVKREMLQTIRAVGFEPIFVIDDRARVVKMWRSEGLVCFQCAEGDF